MGDLVVFRAAPCPEEGIVQRAMIALCQRMEKRDLVAVVRYVYRNKAAPKLGILFPVWPVQCRRFPLSCRGVGLRRRRRCPSLPVTNLAFLALSLFLFHFRHPPTRSRTRTTCTP